MELEEKNPCKEDNDGERAPLEPIGLAQMPAELICLITDYLENPQDLWSLSKTSRQLEYLMEDAKPLWLFDQVLPLIFRQLSKQAVLKCRGICRRWRFSIDNALDTHSSACPIEPVPLQGLKNPECPTLLQQGFKAVILSDQPTRGNLTPFELRLKVGNHSRNPLLLRSIKSLTEDYNERSTYWINMFLFLRQYGQHIWYFHLRCKEGTEQQLDFYKVLRRLLHLTPNLKTLELSSYLVTGHFNCTLNYITQFDYEPSVRILKSYIIRYPLPPMAQLTSLYVAHDKDKSVAQRAITEELFRRYQQQLKKVSIHSAIYGENRPFPLYFWNAKQITELCLFASRLSSMSITSSMKGFLKSVPLFPNLTRLTVLTDYEGGQENRAYIKNIMGELARFPSLRFLRLRYHRMPSQFPEPPDEPVKCPNIKSLDIFVTHNEDALYNLVLCHLPNLEYINISRMSEKKFGGLSEDFETWTRRMRIRAADDSNPFEYSGLCLNHIYQSKAWRKIPSLKEIRVGRSNSTEKKIYTREYYNYLKAREE